MLKLESDPSFIDSHSTLEIALILGGVAVGALVIAAVAFRVRSRWLLAATLVLGVVQLFGPFGFTSGALLITCTLLPAAFWRRRDDLRDLRFPATIWALLLAALAAWQVVSVLWSAKVGAAGYGVIFSIAVLTAYLLARDVVERDARGVPAAIAAASPFVIVSALVVILFRLSPAIEASYLLSPIARLFSEPDVALVTRSEIDIALDPLRSLGVFVDVSMAPGAAGGLLKGLFDSTTLTNFQNVLDPTKAGGVFLNGNTASLFFAVTACTSVWALTRGRLRVLHALTAVAAIAAIVATGSKTALMLLVGLPLLALLVAFAVRRPRAGAITGSALVAAGVIGAGTVVALKPALATEGTMGDRFTLWRMVADSFPEHFLLGFGFGNWREHIVTEWNSYFPGVATQIWPPHNLVLQAWVDAGIVALILTVAIVAIPIVASLRRIGEARRKPLLGASSFGTGLVFVALAWVLLHGMADTTFFAGDNHTLPFVAMLSAVALTRSSKLAS